MPMSPYTVSKGAVFEVSNIITLHHSRDEYAYTQYNYITKLRASFGRALYRYVHAWGMYMCGYTNNKVCVGYTNIYIYIYIYSASQKKRNDCHVRKMAPRRDLKKLSINPLLGNFATV